MTDSTSQAIERGARLALQYRHLPTWQRLCCDHGISRATAYRWRRALERAGIKPIPVVRALVHGSSVPLSQQGQHA